MMINFESVLKSGSLCAKCRSAGITFNCRTSLRWLFILRFNSLSASPAYCSLHLVHSTKVYGVFTLAVRVMVNCISPFVLVTLKRSCLNYLSATECSVF